MSKKLKNIKKTAIKNNWRFKILLCLVVLIAASCLFSTQITQALRILDWHLFKEYLSLVFSWPTAIVIVGLVFMSKFHSALDSFLTNANYVKAGMFEAGVQSNKNGGTNAVDEQVRENLEQIGITFTDEQLKQIEDSFQSLVDDNNQKAANIQNKDNMIEWLAERTVQFEFKYLDLHLVPRTKFALAGLININKKLVDFMNDVIMDNGVADATHERNAVLQALQENELIEVKSGQVSITDKGRRFLDFIGLARRG
ncbi:hypothetical protein KC967_02800 [Candidatus Saccharibacteria bacterium]|nr:hypothetical protein [Candidatus Saccharibacteria bacterium]